VNPHPEKNTDDDFAERLKRAEDALRARELDFQLIVNSIPVPVAVTSPTGEVAALNKPTLEYFGRTFEELKGWKNSDVVHPDDLERTIAAQLEAHKTGSAYNVESRHRRADGIYRWFNVVGLPLRDAQGHILHWFHLQIDIDDRKQAEALLAGEKRLLEMVGSGCSLSETLEALCRIVEDIAGSCYCGVYLIDPTGKTFHNAAAPTLPASFNDPIEGALVDLETGPCGMAACLKIQVIASDIAADSRWPTSVFRTLALANGLKSCWSTPILSSTGAALGTFAIYQNEPASPTPIQQQLIARFTHIASIAIERASSEEALKRSERNLSLTINTIPTFIQVSRSDGTVLSVNQAVLDYYGVDLQDMQKEDFRPRVYHPDDVQRLHEWRKEALKRPQQFEYEQRALGKDGKYRWFSVRYNPLLDDQGRIERWYTTAFDIEDRKRAEHEREQSEEALRNALAEIQKSESKLRQVIDAIPAMAWSAHPDGSGEFFNQHYLDYVGLPAEYVMGWGWTAAIHPDDLESLSLIWQQIRESEQFGEGEVRLRRHDGEYRWFLFHVNPVRDESGRIIKWYGTNLDITDRKLIEVELRRSEEFLAQAQQLSRTGSFSWRVASDEITWSDELYRIYELEPGVAITLDVIRSRVHPEDLTLYEKMVEQARNGAADFEWQYRLLMPDQSIKYMHAVAHATRDQNGQLEYIAAVRDVTARRLSDEALDKARSDLAHVSRVMSLGALTASIAHEVNQPLSGIITNASTCVKMLDADPPNVDGARETAKRTIRDGRRAADVITRLRALFGKKEAATELVDLNEATREVIALSLSELERNKVITRTELADELPFVTGDRVQLQQVIINLLRNGSDAMSAVDDRPRELLFKTELDENDCVRLSVRDAGTGLDPQTLDQLFRSFYTTKADGMGIGLSVSRSIIENHRGRLWATPNDGPGVTFSFSIPIDASQSWQSTRM
jgi:PAS domain S-box-containing protein